MRLRPGSALVVLFCHALPMAHAVAGDCQAHRGKQFGFCEIEMDTVVRSI